MSRARKLKTVSLFSGAGGLDLGFEAVGFKHIACIEKDDDARQSLLKNRPNWGLWSEADIYNIDPHDVLNEHGLGQGDLDVLVGGPPCQPFSKSAYWVKGDTTRLLDERADTLRAFLSFAEVFLPKAIVIENVKGIAYRKKDEAVAFVERWLRIINREHGVHYKLNVASLNALNFGVAQSRERTFLIAFRDGSEFECEPRYFDGDNKPKNQIRTSWDAIGDVTVGKKELRSLAVSGKWADLLASVPEGQNYLWHTSRGGGLPLFGWRTRYWSFLLKLSKKKPSWTLQASPGPATGPFHWKSRYLSVQEMCRLQTFPDDFEIVGSYRAARRQIGNAVPCALAEAVAQEVRSIVTGKNCRRQLKLAIQTSSKAPRAERTKEVASQYFELLGDHADHPGTGLGPGAIERESNAGGVNVGNEGSNRVTVDVDIKQLATTEVAKRLPQ